MTAPESEGDKPPLRSCFDCKFQSSGRCENPFISPISEPLFWAVLKCGENRFNFRAKDDENTRPTEC